MNNFNSQIKKRIPCNPKEFFAKLYENLATTSNSSIEDSDQTQVPTQHHELPSPISSKSPSNISSSASSNEVESKSYDEENENDNQFNLSSKSNSNYSHGSSLSSATESEALITGHIHSFWSAAAASPPIVQQFQLNLLQHLSSTSVPPSNSSPGSYFPIPSVVFPSNVFQYSTNFGSGDLSEGLPLPLPSIPPALNNYHIEKAHQEDKIASLIAIEGGHAIGNSLAVLRILYDLGARSFTLTHNCNTPWADSASSDHYLPDRGGLTEFGKLVVLECNRLGIIVDLAHVSTKTMHNALAITRAPVIFSHSAASSLCNHSRNVPDEIMELVATNGGMVMVSFYNVFITCNETATMNDVIAHIEHIREVAGVDHVGIGAGYDGINFVPSGLEDVSKYPALIEALYNREGWTEMDLKKLIGLNFLRVFRQVEAVRDEWKHVGVGPIEEWIPKNELVGHPSICSSRDIT